MRSSVDTPNCLYRYNAVRHSVTINAEMEMYGVSKPRLVLQDYKVVATTKKGYWITYLSGGKDKWVSASSWKRFAHPTKKEALESYIQRKKAYVRYASHTLSRAEEDLAIVEPDNNCIILEGI